MTTTTGSGSRSLSPLVPFAAFLMLSSAFFPIHFAAAAEPASGFLDDRDQLEKMADQWISYGYMAPGFEGKIAAAKNIVIEQPEIHIAADSPYRGIKPDDMKLLADGLRDATVASLSGIYEIADAPGADTLFLRMGLTNVHLKKKRRRLLGYTPVGLVLSTAKRALIDDFTDKVLLKEVVLEYELLDMSTGERVAAMVIELGEDIDGEGPADWAQLEAAMGVSAARLECRFRNAGLAQVDRQDCAAITEAPNPG